MKKILLFWFLVIFTLFIHGGFAQASSFRVSKQDDVKIYDNFLKHSFQHSTYGYSNPTSSTPFTIHYYFYRRAGSVNVIIYSCHYLNSLKQLSVLPGCGIHLEKQGSVYKITIRAVRLYRPNPVFENGEIKFKNSNFVSSLILSYFSSKDTLNDSTYRYTTDEFYNLNGFELLGGTIGGMILSNDFGLNLPSDVISVEGKDLPKKEDSPEEIFKSLPDKFFKFFKDFFMFDSERFQKSISDNTQKFNSTIPFFGVILDSLFTISRNSLPSTGPNCQIGIYHISNNPLGAARLDLCHVPDQLKLIARSFAYISLFFIVVSRIGRFTNIVFGRDSHDFADNNNSKGGEK